jgi:hypothetical protein
VRSCLTWFKQIDAWCDAWPIVGHLGQMRRLDRHLFCQLGDALCDGEHARDLFSCQLELANRGGEQALACCIKLVGRSRPAACLPCTGDE